MSAKEWWENITGMPPKRPIIERAPEILGKACPFFMLISNVNCSEQDYWAGISSIMHAFLSTARDPQSDFNGFVEDIFNQKDTLKEPPVQTALQIIEAGDSNLSFDQFIWQFAAQVHPYYMAKLLRAISKTQYPLPKYLTNTRNFDLLIDHYSPTLNPEALNPTTEAFEPRFLLCDSLVRLFIRSTAKQDIAPECIVFLFRRLSKMAKKANGYDGLTAFRYAAQLFRECIHIIKPMDAANHLLKFIERFDHKSPLYFPAVELAIMLHPQEFGFVSLMKSILSIPPNHNTIAVIQRILMLPYVRNPTDIYRILMKTAVTDRILGGSARHAIVMTFAKYENIEDIKKFSEAFIKRSFHIIASSARDGHHRSRSFRAILLMEDLRHLRIGWLSIAIGKYAAAAVELGANSASELAIGTAPSDAVAEFSRKDVDEAKLLDAVEGELPLIASSQPSKEGSARASARAGSGRKPTIAEVKAKYREQMARGQYVPPNDLSLLKG